MLRNNQKLLLTLASALLLSACYEEEEATVEVMQLTPARVDLSHQRIAVLPFAGLGGEVWAERVHSDLVARGLDVAPPVAVRDDAYHAVEDITEVAAIVGADVVLEGGTTDIDVLEELEHSYDPEARLTTYYRMIKLVLRGQAQVRDARGGTLYTLRLDASHAPRAMGAVRVNGKPPHDEATVEGLLEPFDALAYLHQQVDELVDALREETQPVYRRAAWILFQSPSLPDSLHAVDQARAMHWKQAAAIYEKALSRVKKSEARALVRYNLGVAQAMQGLHEDAAHNLRAAAELTRKPRVRALCAEVLADNNAILMARQQVKTLGWSLEK